MHTATSRLREEATKLAHALPLHAVGVAAAVGYVLGGGLLSPLTRRLVALGIRWKLRDIVQNLVDARLGGHDRASAEVQKSAWP